MADTGTSGYKLGSSFFIEVDTPVFWISIVLFLVLISCVSLGIYCYTVFNDIKERITSEDEKVTEEENTYFITSISLASVSLAILLVLIIYIIVKHTTRNTDLNQTRLMDLGGNIIVSTKYVKSEGIFKEMLTNLFKGEIDKVVEKHPFLSYEGEPAPAAAAEAQRQAEAAAEAQRQAEAAAEAQRQAEAAPAATPSPRTATPPPPAAPAAATAPPRTATPAESIETKKEKLMKEQERNIAMLKNLQATGDVLYNRLGWIASNLASGVGEGNYLTEKETKNYFQSYFPDLDFNKVKEKKKDYDGEAGKRVQWRSPFSSKKKKSPPSKKKKSPSSKKKKSPSSKKKKSPPSRRR